MNIGVPGERWPFKSLFDTFEEISVGSRQTWQGEERRRCVCALGQERRWRTLGGSDPASAVAQNSHLERQPWGSERSAVLPETPPQRFHS